MLHMYYGALSLNKRDFRLNGKGWGSLTEVFYTVNYTSCNWACFLKILRHTSYLDGHIGIPPKEKYMKFIHLYISSYKITLLLLSFKKLVSLKKFPFSHYLQSIFLSIMFAWFDLVVFFILVFFYTCLWILVYLQFTKYGLVFKWLTVTANELGEGIQSFYKRLFCHQKTIK